MKLRLSSLGLIAGVALAVNLAGCKSDAEDGLQRRLNYISWDTPSLLVESVICGAPIKNKRTCSVKYIKDANLPVTEVNFDEASPTFPADFSFSHGNFVVFGRSDYRVQVSTSLDESQLPLEEASAYLIGTLTKATALAQDKLGERYTTNLKLYRNKRSYTRD